MMMMMDRYEIRILGIIGPIEWIEEDSCMACRIILIQGEYLCNGTI